MVGNAVNYNRLDDATEARVEDLLARMTLDEKVGQMVQEPPHAPDLDEGIRQGQVGSVLSIHDPQRIRRWQRIAVEESRLGVPLLIGNDVIHGYRTIFPIPLAESCTWDPPLLERAARAAAEEASAMGTSWIFAPMVDIARDPRWGRVAEGAGEDPFLGSAMAQARVRGFQADDLRSGRRVLACPKHFAAYGAAEAGRDYNTVDLSQRTLRDVYLPPFQAAFAAGAGSVMTSFNEIGGVPSVANSFLQRTVLREEWNVQGMTISDYEAVQELAAHGVAAGPREAAALAARAGTDMDMAAGVFRQHLAALVREGTVDEAVVEAAARRILRLKFSLGLFEQPYADLEQVKTSSPREEHRALALEVAQKSIVLLKNEGNLLPLGGRERLALIGPLGDDAKDLLGAWAIQGRAEEVDTVLAGLRSVWADPSSLTFVPGCSISGPAAEDFAAAVAAARAAEVVVLAVGESAKMSGEAHSRAHLDLPGQQAELVEAVRAAGTPVVAVVLSGRPLVIPWADHVPAVIQAWQGGARAGRALADVLVGAVNPSGKLTISVPRAVGQIPVYYNHKPTGRPLTGVGTQQFGDEIFKSRFLDVPNDPHFPFGHGLSYTTFSYSDLTVETPTLRPEDTLQVSVVVANDGDRAGDEVVQLYVRDVVASVTRPVKELKGFQRVSLEPGERKQVPFAVPAAELGFHDQNMEYVVEPGSFKVWVGPDSVTGLEGEFEVVMG